MPFQHLRDGKKKNKLGACWKEKAVVPFRISSLTLWKKSGKRERHNLNWASWYYSKNQGSCRILTLMQMSKNKQEKFGSWE